MYRHPPIRHRPQPIHHKKHKQIHHQQHHDKSDPHEWAEIADQMGDLASIVVLWLLTAVLVAAGLAFVGCLLNWLFGWF